jgi:hypothetical protein
VQSLLFTHQFRSVKNAQKWRPNPMTTSIAPAVFIGTSFNTIAGCPTMRSTHAINANNKRLITAPLGPTPNNFSILSLPIKQISKPFLTYAEGAPLYAYSITGISHNPFPGKQNYLPWIESSDRRLRDTETLLIAFDKVRSGKIDNGVQKNNIAKRNGTSLSNQINLHLHVIL